MAGDRGQGSCLKGHVSGLTDVVSAGRSLPSSPAINLANTCPLYSGDLLCVDMAWPFEVCGPTQQAGSSWPHLVWSWPGHLSCVAHLWLTSAGHTFTVTEGHNKTLVFKVQYDFSLLPKREKDTAKPCF